MSERDRKLLETTKAFVVSLDSARHPQALSDAILDFMKQFGAEYVLAGKIPITGTPSLIQKNNILLKNWPEEWSNRYFRRNYIFSDPVIKNLHETWRPFYWSEVDHLMRDHQKSVMIMNEAREFGLGRGITVAVVTIENDIVGFSLAGKNLEVREEIRHAISIIANYAVARAIALCEIESKFAVKLSSREREVLQCVADGRLRHEISDTMKISEHGVDKHLRSCRDKLNTRSTPFAVAEALRLRIIA